MIGLFIKILTLIEAIIFIISICFMLYFGGLTSSTGLRTAHITGAITIVTLILNLVVFWKAKQEIGAWLFILCFISTCLMFWGYMLFYVEKISPIWHAGASMNFDLATTGRSLAIILLIGIITKKNKK